MRSTLCRAVRTAGMFSVHVLKTVILLAGSAATALAAPSNAPITGEIERLTLKNDNGIYSSGVMVVGGQEIILPKNLLIDLPANRLTLKQIFDQAPAACVALGESGLAKADRCNTMLTGANATISANRTNAGNAIAGDVLIQKGIDSVTGQVTFINYTDGYFRLNGAAGSDNTGVIVRLNDPTSRHTVQQGAGCAGGPNCSADPRFTLDPDNYVSTFTTGYPFCIPSTVPRQFPGLPAIVGIPVISAQFTQAAADGSGDLLCPSTNRTAGVINENPVADSRRFAPLLLGDSVTAEGNFESVNGVRFLSAHTTKINKALQTRNSSDQPDYLFLDEVFIDGPAFQNQRIRALIIGYTTLAPTDVDFWTIHRDPANNAIHEFPFASVQGCDAAAGAGTCGAQGLGGAAGNNIFRIRYDVDFNLLPAGVKDAKLSPCHHLNASRFGFNTCSTGSMADQFAVMSPMPHEIQARTGHRIVNPGLANVTIDVNGKPATNGQYLFPFGMNLGGIDMPNFFEIDLNLVNTPTSFEGIPWNLDRRLGPGGCLDDNGNPIVCQAGAMGTFALDPFPYSGLDPRTQAPGLPAGTLSNTRFTATPLSNARNRIFSYVNGTNFTGNTSVLPYVLGTFPADPTLIAINPTPALNVFPPFADEDAAATGAGVPVVIDVLANDIPVLGSINPASVAIATPPASGTVSINPATGAITYTPAALGTFTFTYTVANNFGSVSLPGTVTVTIITPPGAVNDTPTVSVNSTTTINLLTNDVVGTNPLNLASVNIVSPTSCGTLVNQQNGNVVFTAPAAPGTCSFSYVVSDTSVPPLPSNVATVTITVSDIAPATGVTASAAPTGTQTINTPVVITATGAGGTGQYEYRFYVNDGGTFYLIQPYGVSNTCTWVPGKAGTYDFFVEVRSAGTTVLRDAYVNVFAYAVTSPAATNVYLSTNALSPQAVNTPITFSAQGAGGTGTYEYRFWLNSGSGFVVAQDYSTNSTWIWTPIAAGTYDMFVEVRMVGSASVRDAFNEIVGYQVQ